MQLEQFRLNIDKRRDATGLQTTVRPPATSEELDAAENRLGHTFPDQMREFYPQYNGLTVDDPPFEILSVSDLSVDGHSRIHFATADGVHRICFDCSRRNEAEQWDIIDSESGDRITFTMASFCTNKMWKWIDRRLMFWSGEV